jgi:hypothetical protein
MTIDVITGAGSPQVPGSRIPPSHEEHTEPIDRPLKAQRGFQRSIKKSVVELG